jgi:hypothetical protein
VFSTNDTPNAWHDVILAMTLLRRPILRSLDHGMGICIDPKWLGNRLQLNGCRLIDAAPRSCLSDDASDKLRRANFSDQFKEPAINLRVVLRRSP